MFYFITCSFTKDKVRRIVDYIIKEPIEDDEKKAHKFPYVCSELLRYDEEEIYKYFIKTNKELDEETKEEEKKEEKTKEEETGQNEIEEPQQNHEETGQKEIEELQPNQEETGQTKKEEPQQNQEEIPNVYNYELLDYLLTFVEITSPLNYFLSGYFLKTFSFLLIKHPVKIINYLYTFKKDTLYWLIYHSYIPSIAEILEKIILYDSNFFDFLTKNIEKKELFKHDLIRKTRMELIDSILEKIDITKEEISANIPYLIDLITDISNRDEIFMEIIETPKRLNLIFRNFKIDLNKPNYKKKDYIKNNYSKVLNLIIQFLVKIESEEKINPLYDSEGQKIQHTLLSSMIFEYFNNFINNFKSSTSDYNKPKYSTPLISAVIPLGCHRLKIIEFFSDLFPYFRNISKSYDNLLIKSHFFLIAFKYLFNYEWNSIYQIELLELFKNYLRDAVAHKDLTYYLFDRLDIRKRLNDALEGESGKSINTKGYFAFIISLCYKINYVIGGSNNKLRCGSFIFDKKNEEDIYSNQNLNANRKSLLRRSQTITSCHYMKKYNDDKWKDFYDSKIKKYKHLYKSQLMDDWNKEHTDSGEDDINEEEDAYEEYKKTFAEFRIRDEDDQNSFEEEQKYEFENYINEDNEEKKIEWQFDDQNGFEEEQKYEFVDNINEDDEAKNIEWQFDAP